MLILSFSLGMSMEVRRRQAGQVREGKLRYSLNRLFQVGRQGWRGSVTEARGISRREPLNFMPFLPETFNSPEKRRFRGRHHVHVRAGGPASQQPRGQFAAFSGGGSSAEPLWKTADKQIPAERTILLASPSWAWLHPFVPGLFFFRARRASLRSYSRTDRCVRRDRFLSRKGAYRSRP